MKRTMVFTHLLTCIVHSSYVYNDFAYNTVILLSFVDVCDLMTFHANYHGNKPCYANMRMWFWQAFTGLLVYCD